MVSAVLINLTLGFLPLVFVVAVSVLLGRLPDERVIDARVGVPLGVAVLAFVVQQVLAPFQASTGEALARRIDGVCARRLMTAGIGAPLPALEEADSLDMLSDARNGYVGRAPTPGKAAAGAIALIARYTQLAGAMALLAGLVSPWIAVCAGLAAIGMRFGARGSQGRFAELWTRIAGSRRQLNYLRAMASGPEAAKEIRVLGLVGWLRGLHHQASVAYLAPIWAGRRRLLGRPFCWLALVALAGGTAAFLLLGRAGAAGDSGVLELSLAIQSILLALRFGIFFPESDLQIQYGGQSIGSIAAFEARVARSADRRPAGSSCPPPRRAIRFEQVDFHYGDDDRAVLRGLDLTLPVGVSTAIVGLNGAGKTTLVKLLAGFYRPTAGRITVDGADLHGFPADSWHRHLAVLFQDFVRYELSATDNVGLGAPDLIGDPAALAAAAVRGGAAETVAGLPQGWSSTLSSKYRGGRDLSGGQWQRIASARAQLAIGAGASVLILDEPTAQLDVRAEAEFYDHFLELTHGLTSVIISHRFSTVRRADHIVVLAEGRVAEQGTHDELIARGAGYAELFHLQAQRFEARA